MESAYLYVRVSTDEQKKRGFSLIEQEDRLLRYCEMHRIEVKGIFREDFSAKDFNRPEWTRLLKTIKKNRGQTPNNILFIKWDRFSRNIEYAYQMLGILRGLNTKAVAIDQPIDFDVPESIVTLAIYLSIPEAENSRRGKNTSDGMRRARKMGRWPAKAPIGYMNQVSSEGKKIIVPKQPEADFIRWSFEEYSTGRFTINHVRRMVNIKGLKCGRNNFWKALHNPFYCGFVSVPATEIEEQDFVEGIHQPLISQDLFRKVQALISSRSTRNSFKQRMKPVFLLRGYLICPYCCRRVTGSISTGRNAKYKYYHCPVGKCKGRIRAEVIEKQYQGRLKEITFRPEVYELLDLVSQDESVRNLEQETTRERAKLLEKIGDQELLMSKVRRLFLEDKIDNEDFNGLKKEYKEELNFLNVKLEHVNKTLDLCKEPIDILEKNMWRNNIFDLYTLQDVAEKRYIIEFFTPISFNPITMELDGLVINPVIAMIVSYGGQTPTINYSVNNYRSQIIYGKTKATVPDSKVSVDKAIKILKKNGIDINENQAKMILDFLYLVTRTSQINSRPQGDVEQ